MDRPLSIDSTTSVHFFAASLVTLSAGYNDFIQKHPFESEVPWVDLGTLHAKNITHMLELTSNLPSLALLIISTAFMPYDGDFKVVSSLGIPENQDLECII